MIGKKHFLPVLLQIMPSTHCFTHRYCQVIISLKIKFFVRYCIVFTDPEQIHSKTWLLHAATGNPSEDNVAWEAIKGEFQICKSLLPGHLIFIIVCLQPNILTIPCTIAVKPFRHTSSTRTAFAVRLCWLILHHCKGSKPASLHAVKLLSTCPCFRWKGLDRVCNIGTGGVRRKAKDKGKISAIWSDEMKMSRSSSLKCRRMKGTGAQFGVLVCLHFRIKLQRMVKKENSFYFILSEDRMQTAGFIFTSHLDSISVPCKYIFRNYFS